MNSPHQHGPQCNHGHSHAGHSQGHSHGQVHEHKHQGHNHGFQGQLQMTPKQYFQKLKQLKQTTKQFYWMQVLSGNALEKYYQLKNIQFLKALNCQMIQMIIGSAQMMLNFDWVPLILKPFINGLFFPLAFLLFFNFNVLYGFQQKSEQTPNILFLMYFTVFLFILTALRGSGNLCNDTNKQLTKQAYNQRIYLQNPQMNCSHCKILKAFRGFHCPVCKTCIPKFTRHSLAFGICIGAANELLALFFFCSMFYTQFLTLMYFWQLTNYGVVTQIMFYSLNMTIMWQSLVQCCTLFILNIKFGITQFEVRGWMMLQYLLKVPMRQFQNNCNNGFVHNLIQSFYAMINLSGYQGLKKNTKAYIPNEQEKSLLEFQNIDQSKKYVVNWNNAFYYLTPQMPNHKRRNQIIEIMKRDQSKMIEMYKLQKKFKEEVLQEVKGQQLSQFQIQQKVMMKMQQHMMKNSPQMMNQPTTQQQKTIQLQMLSHMKKQLQNQPEFSQKISQLQSNLKQGKVTPVQVNLAMRQIQQQLMAKKMKQILKQKQQMDKKKVEKQDQEASLKRQQQELPDEDL